MEILFTFCSVPWVWLQCNDPALTFSLLNKCLPIISRVVPIINLTDDELAAVTAAIRRAVERDRYRHAPRLEPLRAALARLEAAPGQKTTAELAPVSTPPKAPRPGKGDKRARRQ